MTIHDQLRDLLAKHTGEVSPSLDHPENPEHGDYASPIAIALAKKQNRQPLEVAKELAQKVADERWEVSVAPPGFLNFRISSTTRAAHIHEIIQAGNRYGSNKTLAGKKIMVEYTDPNPFKEFHIGHLMSNAIGEALSRIVEFSGAEVKRANYQGDVGLHVAKALWGKMKNNDVSWGEAYATGAQAYEADERAREEIIKINKLIYNYKFDEGERDKTLENLYEKGIEETMWAFEKIYKRLGMEALYGDGAKKLCFYVYFYEYEAAEIGKKIVEKNIDRVFEKSDGAIIYRGEKHGLHTRVFITSHGLPTYETKELGLTFLKYWREKEIKGSNIDLSIVVTGHEIKDYFQVVLAAMRDIGNISINYSGKSIEVPFPKLVDKTEHIPHGMLRLKSGKMSSRTGEVIRAEDLLNEAKERLREKTADEAITEAAALGAVKYSILRQSAGKDIIFDFNTSLSFEGDSGPYLQYTHARARSILEKSEKSSSDAQTPLRNPSGIFYRVERLLLWFPDAIAEALNARDPHYIATYLADLAQAFNSLYAKERILGANDESYKLALTAAVAATLKNGLWLLGIPAPERM